MIAFLHKETDGTIKFNDKIIGTEVVVLAIMSRPYFVSKTGRLKHADIVKYLQMEQPPEDIKAGYDWLFYLPKYGYCHALIGSNPLDFDYKPEYGRTCKLSVETLSVKQEKYLLAKWTVTPVTLKCLNKEERKFSAGGIEFIYPESFLTALADWKSDGF